MRAWALVTVVTAALLLAGCTPGDDDADDDASDPPETCTVSLDLRELDRDQLERVDPDGPLVDRDLRASRSPQGDLCLDIVIDHADPGSTAVSYAIVARQGDREWRVEGEDPNAMAPMLVDTTGCVSVSGELEALGADGEAHPYRGRLRIDCTDRTP